MRQTKSGQPDLRDVIANSRRERGLPTPEENVAATFEGILKEKEDEIHRLRIALKTIYSSAIRLYRAPDPTSAAKVHADYIMRIANQVLPDPAEAEGVSASEGIL